MTTSSSLAQYRRIALFLLWTIGMLGLYYYFHPEYLACDLGSIPACVEEHGVTQLLRNVFFNSRMLYVVALFALYVGWLLWTGKKEIKLHLTAARVMAWLYAFSIGAIVLLFIFKPDHTVVGNALVFALPSVVTKLTGLFIAFGTLLLVGATFGWWVLRRLRLDIESAAERFLLSVGIGWIVLSFIAFILLALGQFSALITIAVLLALLLVCRTELQYWLDALVTHRWTYTVRAISLESFLLIFIHALIGFNLLEGIMPFPLNWDGVYRYANTVNLIATSGSFIGDVFPYPFEIIMAYGKVVFTSMMISNAIAWFVGWLAAYTLYIAVRRFAERTPAILLTVAFLTLPAVFYIMSYDIKVDMASAWYVLLSVLALMRWHGSKHARMVWIAALFTGFAVLIKLIVAFYAVGFVGMLCTIMIMQRWSLRQMIATGSVAAVCMMLPFVPWMAKNIIETSGDLSMHAVLRGAYEGPDMGACSIREEEHYIGGDARTAGSATIEFTGHREEIGRYWGYGKRQITDYFSLPWMLTLGTQVPHTINQIGPVFVIFLFGFALLYPRFSRASADTKLWTPVISVGATITGVLWVIYGQAIAWYGLPALLLLLILIGLYIAAQEKTSGFGNASALIVALVLCTGVMGLFRISTVAQEYVLQTKFYYLSGFEDAEKLPYREPINFQTLADTINADEPTADDPKYVYNIGSHIVYRIHENDKRMYNDHFMDTMNCLLESHDRDYAATYDDLKGRGFKYLIANPQVESVDSTPEHSLSQKLQKTADFVNAMIGEGKITLIADFMKQEGPQSVAFELH